jgi:NodT family efflux transporter outer membrane factor (OMF) lipoprotein
MTALEGPPGAAADLSRPAQRLGRIARKTLAALAAALLAACAADPALAPHEKMPTSEEAAAKLGLRAADGAAALSASWWTAYNDPELTRWVELGLADSPTLRQAGARVERAEALFAAARAAQAPNVAFGADSTAQRVSGTGLYPPPLAGMIHTINDVDLSASIELDLFGRLAARADAARLSAQAGAADRELARVRLAAAIGHAYFELARAQQARRLAVELEAQSAQILDLVLRRVSTGLDTQVERRLAEVPVPQMRVEIEQADEQAALARHALALLAGQGPQAADAVEARLPDAAMLTPPAALPLDLLARRPDIAAAQARVLAALRGVDAARADFYPNVNLSALVGLNSLTTQLLFEGASRTWQVGPAIHLPLFDGGMLRAHLRSASADADEAIDAYQASILQAAGEVADALASVESIKRQRTQQALATESAQAASDLANIRYQAGLGNYLSVLAAQNAVLTQRRSDLDLAARSAALDVSLALALGGGFHQAQPQTAAR